MAALAFAWPLAPLFAWPWRALGVVPIAAGVWLNLAADRAFKERRTTVKPFERSSALVTDGVFEISRNPMYLGMVLILVGVALLLGALSPFLVTAGFAAIVETRFIPVEERDALRNVRRRMDEVSGEDTTVALGLFGLGGQSPLRRHAL